MPAQWSTTRRHDGDSAPGLDVSRLLVMGLLIAALLGLLTGIVWMGWKLSNRFGG